MDTGLDVDTGMDRPWPRAGLEHLWTDVDSHMDGLPPSGLVEEAVLEPNPEMCIPRNISTDIEVLEHPEQAYVGNGTIDPSLLAGPSSALLVRSRTPSPALSALSPLTSSPAQPLSQHGALSAKNTTGKKKVKAKDTKGGKGGKGEERQSDGNERATPGKGKGRADDVGYRTRLLGDVGGAANGVEDGSAGKRARKLGTKAKEAKEQGPSVAAQERTHPRAGHCAGSDDDEIGNDDNGGAGEKRMTQAEIDRLALEIPYCHQCRNQNRYEKMRCSVINDNGTPCGLQFCEKCIVIRCVFVVFCPLRR
jgi:hypothetical protein